MGKDERVLDLEIAARRHELDVPALRVGVDPGLAVGVLHEQLAVDLAAFQREIAVLAVRR